ncbi:NADH-quinone oxidoreductase subunit C [Salinispira pacifica]
MAHSTETKIALDQSRLGTAIKEIEHRFELSDAYAQRENLAFVTVGRSDAVPLLTHLRDNSGFHHLVMVTVVDIIERGLLRIVYLLHNYTLGADIGVQVEIPRGEQARPVDGAAGDGQGGSDGVERYRSGHNGDTLLGPGLESAHAPAKPAYTEMDSIHHLWAQAATYQRELKEMYGIHFPGSPRIDEEFALEGWNDVPPMRREFDTREYSEKTFFPRPGRKTHDPVEYMKQNMYPDPDGERPPAGTGA